jgi:copper chaperone CopZ
MNHENKTGSGKSKRAKSIAFIGAVLIVCALLGVIAIVSLSKASLASSAAVSSPPRGAVSDAANLRLKVNIPCPGHAGLITGELKKVPGVELVKFTLPNVFDVTYDPSKISKEAILGIAVFGDYPAEEISRYG